MKPLPQDFVAEFIRVRQEVLPRLRGRAGAELHAMLCERDLWIAKLAVRRGDLDDARAITQALKEWHA